jgi:hypothetical protein
MNVLKVISEGPHDLKTVVSGALEKEARLLEAGIRKTEKRLSAFEEKYQKKTEDFLADYNLHPNTVRKWRNRDFVQDGS